MGEQAPASVAWSGLSVSRSRGPVDQGGRAGTHPYRVQYFTIGAMVSLYFTLLWGKENSGDGKEREQTQLRTLARRRLFFGVPRSFPESISLGQALPRRMCLAVTRTTSIP
jgi:hypothetical protein